MADDPNSSSGSNGSLNGGADFPEGFPHASRLKQAGVTSLADLRDVESLEDLSGIGPAYAQDIQNALEGAGTGAPTTGGANGTSTGAATTEKRPSPLSEGDAESSAGGAATRQTMRGRSKKRLPTRPPPPTRTGTTSWALRTMRCSTCSATCCCSGASRTGAARCTSARKSRASCTSTLGRRRSRPAASTPLSWGTTRSLPPTATTAWGWRWASRPRRAWRSCLAKRRAARRGRAARCTSSTPRRK